MVKVKEFDDLLGAMSRFGESGRLSSLGEQARINDELVRQISVLAKVNREIIRHLRQGPDWEKQYTLNSGDADATTKQLVFEHDLNFTPSGFVVNRITSSTGTSTVANHGSMRMLQADENTVTVQFDDTAYANQMNFRVHLTRVGFVPVGVT